MEKFSDRLDSVARHWRLPARFVETDARLARRARQGRFRLFAYEFLRFGLKQAWASLFAFSMLALLVGSRIWYPAGAPLTRYDFLFLTAIALQIGLVAARFESLREAGVIFAFHVVGTLMEVFKTSVGSWTYPEPSLFHIGGVPLFTGFLYASIGSYMMRAWDLFDFRFSRHPPLVVVVALAAAIYTNFFLDHWGWDLRVPLFAATIVIFGRSWIAYRVHHHWRHMPLLLAALLATCFIWSAENAGTYTHTWLYPGQQIVWRPVGLEKFGSWFLLQIVSYAIVALARRPRRPEEGPIAASQARHARRIARRSATTSG